MAGGRVAMQVQAAGGLQHAVQLHQPGGHHHQVGHHLVLADELAHGPQHDCHPLRRVLDDGVVGQLGAFAPVPGVVEGGHLRLRLLPALVLEQHVVRAVRVERRVEVDQVDRLVLDVLAQDDEVVTVVKSVHIASFLRDLRDIFANLGKEYQGLVLVKEYFYLPDLFA